MHDYCDWTTVSAVNGWGGSFTTIPGTTSREMGLAHSSAGSGLQRDNSITRSRTYSVCFVFRAAKVHHAVEAGERRASTLVSVRVEFLLRKDVAAVLVAQTRAVSNKSCIATDGGVAIGYRRIIALPRKKTTPYLTDCLEKRRNGLPQ